MPGGSRALGRLGRGLRRISTARSFASTWASALQSGGSGAARALREREPSGTQRCSHRWRKTNVSSRETVVRLGIAAILLGLIVRGSTALVAQTNDPELAGSVWIGDSLGMAKLSSPTNAVEVQVTAPTNITAVAGHAARGGVLGSQPPSFDAFESHWD